ncbi:glycoside hydrolase family 26 protein [Nocardioides mangrovicus]|nr:glycosyl hydrolase [Nocardioides mangrovicus]
MSGLRFLDGGRARVATRLSAMTTGALLMGLCAITAQGTADPQPAPRLAVSSALAASYATPSERTASRHSCGLGQKLVPKCHILQGALVQPADYAAPQDSFLSYEAMVGVHQNVLHYYHQNQELFPTPWELGLVNQPGSHRILFVSWKPEAGYSWADVAAGKDDAYLDREAAYLKATFHKKFFLALHHEPEEEVIETPGSGYTASDYSAMYRHVVDRLRAAGVDNAVMVMQYMGAQTYAVRPWFGALWPGDDYVDWIGFDPYQKPNQNGQSGGFRRLMNLRWGNAWPGEYRWAVRHHPGKPIMLAEWGIAEKPGVASWKGRFFRNVVRNLHRYPELKAMVYFNQDVSRVQSSRISLRGFKKLARNKAFRVRVP